MSPTQFSFRFISRKNRKNNPDVKKMYLIFSFWPLFATGQVSTGFESGLGDEWEQFPESRWESSPDKALSGSYSLFHAYDNPEAGTDRISFNAGVFDRDSCISWKFSLRHGYSPSSSNKWQVFLATDKPASLSGSTASLNGYVIGVNVTGSDDSLRVYLLREGKYSVLCKTSVNFEKDIGTEVFHCFVKRSADRQWEIFTGLSDSVMQKTGFSPEPKQVMPALSHFMLSYSYTSAKDRLLWFDDLQIQASFIVDTVPPQITGFTIPNRNSVSLAFSEELDCSRLQKDQFRLVPGNTTPENIKTEGLSVYCTFGEDFRQKTEYFLIATSLKDNEGNLMSRDSIRFFVNDAEKNDLVITEIMADPSPPVYLRESEYVELFNRSGFPVRLDSFALQTGTREWLLPPYEINPGEYLVVTSGHDTGSNVIPLFTSSSVITNDGQLILLRNRYGEMITAAEFYVGWYGDAFKSQGGWSLERIDAENLCGGQENWTASIEHLGGTPGWHNSVQAETSDLKPPNIERLEFVKENSIRLVFSENVDPTTVPGPETFRLASGLLVADSVLVPEYFCSNAEIVFKESFVKGTIYEMEVPGGIADCAGNQLVTKGPLRFGLPSSTGLADIIITELLFSSIPGCVEYLELYNRSDQLLELSDLRIVVSQEGEAGKPSIPLTTPVLFFPGEYRVLCKDKNTLISCHDIQNPESIVEAKELPSLPDLGACIKLLNRSLESVDMFCYAPEDEFPMLSDSHGVSLERLSLDKKTGDQSFWHSASSVSGFGTPGMENSQCLSGILGQKKFEISPEIFSPDNNGKDDMLEISYSMDKEGFIGTVAVFDPSGRLVRYIGTNEILGTSGLFLWDGRDEFGKVCATGLYLIYAEIWNLEGEKEKFKKPAVLVRE